MRRLRHSDTERQAARPVWVNSASLLQRARSAPASASTPTPSLTLDERPHEGRDVHVVSREAANLAEQWRRAPPISRHFGEQAVVQSLLTRLRQGAASPPALALANRKRSRTHDDS